MLEVIGETLWVGTKNNGLHAVVLPLTRARSVRIPGLASSYVTVVMNGMAGSPWAGTNNALHRIDIAGGTVVETIKSVPADTTTLANGWVTALALDRQGRLWIGSFGGIDILLGRTPDGKPRFHRLGTAQGLPNLNISKLLPDRQGYLWASTDDGIARINPTTFAIDALKRADGVAYPGYWNNSGAVTAEGELLFGGTAGLTIIAPERLQPWRQRAGAEPLRLPPGRVRQGLDRHGRQPAPGRLHQPGAGTLHLAGAGQQPRGRLDRADADHRGERLASLVPDLVAPTRHGAAVHRRPVRRLSRTHAPGGGATRGLRNGNRGAHGRSGAAKPPMSAARNWPLSTRWRSNWPASWTSMA